MMCRQWSCDVSCAQHDELNSWEGGWLAKWVGGWLAGGVGGVACQNVRALESTNAVADGVAADAPAADGSVITLM